MPVAPTYPGVYIQEIASGNRTIVGVSTSVTAFVGRARRGPVDEPVRITSFGAFQRQFGALWVKSPLGYAVQQYFLAGGKEALVVRVASNAVEASAALDLHDLFRVEARSYDESDSGDGIYVKITHVSGSIHQFTLEVSDDGLAADETYNVTCDPNDGTRTWIGALADALDDADSLVRLTSLSLLRPKQTTSGTWQVLASGTTGASPSPSYVEKTSADTDFVLTAAGTGPVTHTVTVQHEGGSDTKFTITVTPTSGSPEEYALTIDEAEEDDDWTFVNNVVPVASGLLASITVAEVRPNETATPQSFTSTTTATYTADLPDIDEVCTVTITAAAPGTWSNSLRVSVNHDTSDEDDPDLFNLVVSEVDSSGDEVGTEVFRNVSMRSEHARYLPTILEEQSSYVTIEGASPRFYRHQRLAVVTTASATALTGGDDGDALDGDALIGSDSTGAETGMYALVRADLFNLLCLPPPAFGTELSSTNWGYALEFCEDHRAICLVDSPSSWTASSAGGAFESLGITSENGAIYFPWVKIADSLRENRLTEFAPCGVVAGLIAKTDATRGVWKAPAGLDARTPIVRGLAQKLTDADQGDLNPLGLNCLRTFPGVGTVVWGGRTLAGNDRLSSDWKYLPVRRLALYIEESLYRGMQWAVFEPNDEPLWGQIRMAAGGFMHQLFRQGAFKGASAKDAYFVKCDAETTTDTDIDLGIVNLHIGFAPLKPAEFVVISIKQLAGQVNA